jgi:hypothetical protein
MGEEEQAAAILSVGARRSSTGGPGGRSSSTGPSGLQSEGKEDAMRRAKSSRI